MKWSANFNQLRCELLPCIMSKNIPFSIDFLLSGRGENADKKCAFKRATVKEGELL